MTAPSRQRLDLAMAVAENRARAHLYDGQSNRLAGWCSVEEAVERGLPFVVRVSDDVFAADLDTPEEIARLDQLVEEIIRSGLAPVVVESGQEGRRHVFARCRSVEKRVTLDDFAAALCGSRTPLRRDIRPPLTPHRLGLPVALLEPVDAVQAVERLEATRGRAEAGGDAEPSRLGKRGYAFLRRGDTRGEFHGDRSRVLMSIALSAANAGWSEARLYRALMNPANVGGEKVREIAATGGPESARRYVGTLHSKAAAHKASHPAFADRPEVLLAISDQISRVESGAWPGRTGSTDRAVLLAVAAISLRLGQLLVHPGERRLAEECGMSRRTVRASLDRLAEQGWIRKRDDGRGRTLGIYFLLRAPISAPPLSHPPLGEVVGGSTLSASDDAFRHGAGLNKGGHRLLSVMTHPFTASELSERSGVPVSSTRRMLNLLQEHGVVTKEGEAWSLADPLSVVVGLSLVARSKGKHRAGLDSAEYHEAERRLRHGEAVDDVTDDHQAGWVHLADGSFDEARVDDSVPQAGSVGPLVLTFRHRGERFSITGEFTEVAWTEQANTRNKRFPNAEAAGLPR